MVEVTNTAPVAVVLKVTNCQAAASPLAFNTRFDYQFRGGHRLFVRYNHSRNDELNAVTTGTSITPLISRALSNNGTEIDRTHTLNGQLVSLVNPRLANELRVG